MTGVRISALPVVPSAQLTDIFPVVQGGVTYQESVSQLAALIPSAVWNDVVTGSAVMMPDQGYVSDNGASLVTLTLPLLASFGTTLSIQGKSSGGWSIAQNAGQNIQIGNVSSTVGVGGSVSSTNQFDSLILVCITANTTWASLGGPQSSGLTIV